MLVLTTMKKGPITITVDSPGHGGVCIGRLDGKVVMVAGAIPGETVEARPDSVKKDYMTATVTKVIEPSLDRVEPQCRYYGRCGGCQLQHVSYEGQVRIKEHVLSDSIRRIAKLDIELSPPLTGGPFGYRSRGKFKVSHGRAGFFMAKSHHVVDVESCPLMSPELNGAFRLARPVIAKYSVRELLISSGGGILALAKVDMHAGKRLDELSGALLSAGFDGIQVDAGEEPLCRGLTHNTFELNGLKYGVSAPSFFQSNWELNRRLVGFVCDALGPLGDARVADLYCGAGNFALPLAHIAKEVVGFEDNAAAVADGVRNAALNNIANCRFVHADANALSLHGPFDVVVADPPRTGLSEGALDALMNLAPGRLVYVSCDPATLARDLKKLNAVYDIESIRMVDFFPQTYHLEAAVFLRRR
jgi:23S rRNA (uracil1939-C5)-methyltransferase